MSVMPILSRSIRRTAVRDGFITALAALAVATTGGVSAQVVTLSATTVGQAPEVLGFNSGHFLPGSNTGSWWKLADVNGSRIFSSPSYLTPGTGTYFRSESTASLDATTQADFIRQRAALRASGAATTYIRWDRIMPLYETKTLSGNNSIQLQYAEETMRELGIKPLIVMTRSPASYSWPASPSADAASDWQDRWLAWQQWYAQAFIHARENGVENYQLFNEPDAYGSLTQEQWLEMVQIGANAVESAIADVNRLYGTSLTPHVYGPVTTGPATAAGGWGNLLLNNLNAELFGGPSSSYQLFDHYDYHNYGSSPSRFGTNVADTIAAIEAATGGASELPIVLSEFNTRTSGTYDPADTVGNPNGYTPDSPAMSSRLGQILVNVAENGADELYLFKFSTAGGAFNGVHWQSETGVKNVGGATRSATAYQLFTEGFKGTSLLASPSSTDADLTMAAAFDSEAGRRFAFIANESGTQAKSLSLDLSTWSVPPGSTVTVKQVSGLHQGGISQILTVPADRRLTVAADPFGVVLVTAPTVSGLERTAFTATADATVREGTPTTNEGGAAALLVRSGSTTATHEAAYLKFSVGNLDPSLLFDATLSITAYDPGATSAETAGIICHLYGITDVSWQETTTGSTPGISWSNAPNISQASHPAARTTIDQNMVTGLGSTADILGQFAATGTAATLSLDVSRWLAERLAAGQTEVGFLITRDVRFDGDIDGSHMLSITSREAAGSASAIPPTLTLSTFTAPITIDVPYGSLTQLQTGNSSIRGTSPVTKTGAGMLVLDAANGTSGETTIRAGEVRIAHPLALARSPVAVLPGSRLSVAAGVVPSLPSLAVRGGTLAGSAIQVGGSDGIGVLTIESGRIEGLPELSVLSGGVCSLAPATRVTMTARSLTVDESPGGGRLDLGAGQVAIAPGGVTAAGLRADLLAGRAQGGWNGISGIMSSTAAASGGTRAVGYLLAGDGSARISFAAAGDADLGGQVDIFDLVTINGGGRYGTGQSAIWSEGDFNYDGVTNVFDLVAVNTAAVYGRGSYFPAAVMGGAAVVPEPALLSAAAAAVVAAAIRHHRSRRRLRRRWCCPRCGKRRTTANLRSDAN